ncbi:hypothetical protein [Streptomyces sp. NPDC002599]|uniref:hypothetical protein n=1 Tax=Streptomyces sp. NPDC002599 TaxID=3154421 RepID=UPI00331CC0AE
MTDPRFDEEPPEHLRYRRHLQDLEGVSEADEPALVATVLRDPDRSMAQAAINRHLERRAAQLLTGPRFVTWARTMTTVVGDRPFLARRLHEWTLLRAIALDEPWTALLLRRNGHGRPRPLGGRRDAPPVIISLLYVRPAGHVAVRRAAVRVGEGQLPVRVTARDVMFSGNRRIGVGSPVTRLTL